MNTWNEHVSAALVGTRRRPAPVLPNTVLPDTVPAETVPAETALPDTALPDTAPPETAGADPAARLLDQAALLTVRRRAGVRPGTAEPVAAAPAETVPVVSPEAAHRLQRILAGEQARVLPEWLDKAAESGRRVPPRLLPELLDKGRADRGLRPHIARAAGRRGVWLALQNTDWAYLVAVDGDDRPADPEAWETGTRGERIAHLTRLRATDPAAAVVALRETWAGESAPDRAAFLSTFLRGLGPGDEDFLEAALDDRGQDVRRVAADLLARLPGSAYAARMTERARRCLRAEDRTVRERTQRWIVVEAPDGHDDTMQRDGIPFHATERVGDRSGWLREVIARSPLSTWTELFGLGSMEVVCLPIADAVDHDVHSARDVHLGWARAALRQGDAGWARALLRGGVVLEEVEVLADLLTVLPDDERDGAAADLVRWVDGREEMLRVLGRIPGPWTGQLADVVLGTLADAAGKSDAAGYVARLCRLADERLTPDAAPRLNEIIPARAESWPLSELAETLRFRHDMLAELR